MPSRLSERADRDARLAALAARQHGVVSLRQLRAIGIGDDAATARFRAGRLHRVHRGVYAVGHPLLTLHGRWMAAVLACGPGALLSHVDAAALWGLADASGIAIHVTVATRGGRGRPRIALHRSQLHPEDREREDGIPVTSIARTLLDLAATATPTQLRRAYEQAERIRKLDTRAIGELLDRSNGRRGTGRLRTLLGYDPAAALDALSPLELDFLDFMREANLPPPALNVLVEGYLVDAYWPAARLVVELDSYEFHADREAFERDRRKWADLRLAGYEVLPLTHRQLSEEAEWVASSLRARLRRRVPPANV